MLTRILERLLQSSTWLIPFALFLLLCIAELVQDLWRKLLAPV